jgi:hypothetical protein
MDNYLPYIQGVLMRTTARCNVDKQALHLRLALQLPTGASTNTVGIYTQ